MPPLLSEVSMSVFRKTNWSKGISDRYKSGDGEKELFDYDVLKDGTLEQAPGTSVIKTSETVSTLPDGSCVQSMFWVDYNSLIVLTNSKLYLVTDGNASAATELKGLSSPNNSVNVGTTYKMRPIRISGDEWILLIGRIDSESGGAVSLERPVILYKKYGASWSVRHAPTVQVRTNDWSTSNIAGVDAGAPFTYTYYMITKQEYLLPTGETRHMYGAIRQYTVTCDIDMNLGGGRWIKFIGATDVFSAINTNDDGIYEETTIWYELYRVSQSGGNAKYVGRDRCGTSLLITDTLKDSELGADIYTAGGIQEFDPIMAFKYGDRTTNDICWYAGISRDFNTDTAGAYYSSSYSYSDSKVYQAVKGHFYAAPLDNYIDLGMKVRGIFANGIYPVVICDNGVQRIEGTIGINGVGSLNAKQISDVGTISCDSCVQVKNNIFYMAEDGFYVTDGFKSICISEHLKERYQTDELNNAYDYMGCVYDSYRNVIIWSIRQNRRLWVLHLDHGIKPESCFTIYNNPYYQSDGIELTPTVFAHSKFGRSTNWGNPVRDERKDVIYAQKGAVTLFRFDKDSYIKYRAKAGGNLTDYSYAIQPEWESGKLQFGTTLLKKLITKMVLVLRNDTDVAVDIYHANDGSDTYTQMKSVMFFNNSTVDKFVIRMRRFTAGMLKCIFKSIKIKKAYCNLYRSDDYDTVTVNASGKTALLASGTWPTDCQNYYLYLDDDSYTQEYEILVVSGDTITVSDDGGNLSDGAGKKWIIKGYPKDQKISLISVEIPYQEHKNIYSHVDGSLNENS